MMQAGLTALDQLLHSRYSCRGFLPDPVPEDVLRQIVVAAGRAPSWCNAQPWKVTLTRGAETQRFRTALLETVSAEPPAPDLPWPEQYTGVHQDRRRACGHQLYEAAGIARDDHAARKDQTMRNFSFFDAPHVAIISSGRELGPYGAMDCGGFVTAFTLAATCPRRGQHRAGLGCRLPPVDPPTFRSVRRSVDPVCYIAGLCRCGPSRQHLSHRAGRSWGHL